MSFHCTALAAAILLAAPAAGQAQAPADETAFAIFVSGTQIGREQWSLTKTAGGWTIASTGRIAPPLDFTLSRFEMKYADDWQPLEMRLEARQRNQALVVRTSFAAATATSEVLQNNVASTTRHRISARAAVIPTNVFAAYEALAARLWTAEPHAQLPVYVPPAGEMAVRVDAIATETLEGPNGSFAARRFDVTLQNVDRPVKAAVLVDEHRRLARFEIPEVGLQAVREDVSSLAVRRQTARNAGDADVSIKANGFNLAGTLTAPPAAAVRVRHPAVLLVGGTSPADRDEIVEGVPVFADLAGALAERGHVVLRYDRRGAGQSGGRTDTATLADYADDAAAAINWLADRSDVDRRRIVVAGYMDGGPVALLAAAANKRIAGVVTIGAAGASGADLILLQQQRLLDELKLSPTDRQARIDLQKKIQAAVVSGGSWQGVPEPMRRQADTPWFRSVLAYDPARVLPGVRQPILVLHGDLDPAIPPSEADHLGALAKARRKAGRSEVVHVADVGGALAAAGSSRVSDKVVAAVAAWIRTLGRAGAN